MFLLLKYKAACLCCAALSAEFAEGTRESWVSERSGQRSSRGASRPAEKGLPLWDSGSSLRVSRDMAQGGMPCARGSLVSVRSTTCHLALGIIWWGWTGPGGVRLEGTVCMGQLSTSSRPLGPCSPSSQMLLQGSGLPSAPPQPCPARSCEAGSSQASCQPPPCRAGGLLSHTLLGWA